MRPKFLLALAALMVGVVVSAAVVSFGGAGRGDDNCAKAIAGAGAAVGSLVPGSLARRFAESDLVQAKIEGGNGEFDDCLALVEKAEDEVLHPRH